MRWSASCPAVDRALQCCHCSPRRCHCCWTSASPPVCTYVYVCMCVCARALQVHTWLRCTVREGEGDGHACSHMCALIHTHAQVHSHNSAHWRVCHAYLKTCVGYAYLVECVDVGLLWSLAAQQQMAPQHARQTEWYTMDSEYSVMSPLSTCKSSLNT